MNSSAQLISNLIRDCGLPRHEAWPLLEAASGKTREYWIAHDDEALEPGALALFNRWVRARQTGVPVAYLTHSREFYGRIFWVNSHTLIPRMDTELLIDKALELIDGRKKSTINLCDLGTGSGCIAITLALELRKRNKTISIAATDFSQEALRVARNNAAWLGVTECVQFQQGPWWNALGNSPAKFDGILSNPPYVAAGDPHLLQGDLRFEPPSALTPCKADLVSGTVPGTMPEGWSDTRDGPNHPNGLADIEVIVTNARKHLHPGGFVLTEHGHDQQKQVMAAFAHAGLAQVQGLRDHSGTPRAVLGFSP